MDIRTIISAALILVGAIFLWTAAIGVVRFPDFFSRLHAAGIGDTLKTGLTLLSLKVFLVYVIYLITNPLGTNLIILEAVHARDYQGYNGKRIRKEKGDDRDVDADA